jgi:hypothetical protein
MFSGFKESACIMKLARLTAPYIAPYNWETDGQPENLISLEGAKQELGAEAAFEL